MSSRSDRTEWLQTYLQGDEPTRAERFAEFIQTVKTVAAEEGATVAWLWGRRAVSNLVDFTANAKWNATVVLNATAEISKMKDPGQNVGTFLQLIEIKIGKH